MAISYIGTDSISGLGYGFKNRIINGAMVIDQRNAGASVTIPATTATYGVDRWAGYGSQASKFTIQQSSTAPAGFTNSLVATSSSAYTVGASETFMVQQIIEGFNMADLGWGAAGAQSVTLSFWVRSSLTGTFGGCITGYANSLSYTFAYTISAANTWEQKTVTIAGPTSTTWNTTNSGGMVIRFSLGTGSSVSTAAGSWTSGFLFAPPSSTSVVGTNGATFYITGVQLEKGGTATSFDYRPYGTELALCQRYYYRVNATSLYTPYGQGWNSSTSAGQIVIKHPVRMRVEPSSLDYSLLSSTVLGVSEALVATATVGVSPNNGADTSTIAISSSSLFTSGFVTLTAKASTSSYIGFSAEL